MKTRLVFLFLVLAGLASAQPVWPPDTFSCYYGEITPEAVFRDRRDLMDRRCQA